MRGCDYITTEVAGKPYYCHRRITKHGRCRWHQPPNRFLELLKEFIVEFYNMEHPEC